VFAPWDDAGGTALDMASRALVETNQPPQVSPGGPVYVHRKPAISSQARRAYFFAGGPCISFNVSPSSTSKGLALAPPIEMSGTSFRLLPARLRKMSIAA
jgi:hypothetical protein